MDSSETIVEMDDVEVIEIRNRKQRRIEELKQRGRNSLINTNHDFDHPPSSANTPEPSLNLLTSSDLASSVTLNDLSLSSSEEQQQQMMIPQNRRFYISTLEDMKKLSNAEKLSILHRMAQKRALKAAALSIEVQSDPDIPQATSSSTTKKVKLANLRIPNSNNNRKRRNVIDTYASTITAVRRTSLSVILEERESEVEIDRSNTNTSTECSVNINDRDNEEDDSVYYSNSDSVDSCSTSHPYTETSNESNRQGEHARTFIRNSLAASSFAAAVNSNDKDDNTPSSILTSSSAVSPRPSSSIMSLMWWNRNNDTLQKEQQTASSASTTSSVTGNQNTNLTTATNNSSSSNGIANSDSLLCANTTSAAIQLSSASDEEKVRVDGNVGVVTTNNTAKIVSHADGNSSNDICAANKKSPTDIYVDEIFQSDSVTTDGIDKQQNARHSILFSSSGNNIINKGGSSNAVKSNISNNGNGSGDSTNSLEFIHNSGDDCMEYCITSSSHDASTGGGSSRDDSHQMIESLSNSRRGKRNSFKFLLNLLASPFVKKRSSPVYPPPQLHRKNTLTTSLDIGSAYSSSSGKRGGGDSSEEGDDGSFSRSSHSSDSKSGSNPMRISITAVTSSDTFSLDDNCNMMMLTSRTSNSTNNSSINSSPSCSPRPTSLTGNSITRYSQTGGSYGKSDGGISRKSGSTNTPATSLSSSNTWPVSLQQQRPPSGRFSLSMLHATQSPSAALLALYRGSASHSRTSMHPQQPR